VLEDHGGRIELKDAADFRPGQRGAWMRLRFSITGQPEKGEAKEQAPQANIEANTEASTAVGETKSPAAETNEAGSTTNDETKIEAATGN
jgi:two-component system nitrogen regulation sensor histidine kinase NtrY